MTDKVENCYHCAFGQNDRRQFDWKCRRHAPIHGLVSSNMIGTVWPAVQATDFCGDFELKDAE